jgi:HD-like signal output (HDOD) protein
MAAVAHERIHVAVRFLLEETWRAVEHGDWAKVAQRAELALSLEPENEDALLFADLAARAARRRNTYQPPVQPAASEVELADEEAERATDEPLSALNAAADRAAELMPLPTIAGRLISALDDEAVGLDELGRIIATDQALTARVISAANTANRARLVPATTVREAVAVLGAQDLRAVVSVTDVSRFALTVATLADLLARTARVVQGEAFAAGILHNIGLLAMDRYSPEGLQRAIALKGPGLARLHDREREIFGFSDAELGAALARRWHLPEKIVEAIQFQGFRPDEVPLTNPLVQHVIRARIFARSQGLHDGAEASQRRNPPAEWNAPPLADSLQRMGGLDNILKRVDTFLGTAA